MAKIIGTMMIRTFVPPVPDDDSLLDSLQLFDSQNEQLFSFSIQKSFSTVVNFRAHVFMMLLPLFTVTQVSFGALQYLDNELSAVPQSLPLQCMHFRRFNGNSYELQLLLISTAHVEHKFSFCSHTFISLAVCRQPRSVVVSVYFVDRNTDHFFILSYESELFLIILKLTADT